MSKHHKFSFKPRVNKIEEAHKQSIFYRMKQATTPAEKRAVVEETNPLFYVFGEVRKVFKPYLTYEENM